MPAPERDDVEIEFLPGLGPFVLEEISELFADDAVVSQVGSASCRMRFAGDRVARRCLDLRTAVAVHLVRAFDVPRPKALLGDAAFRDLVALLRTAMSWSAPDAYRSFRLSAAGRDSAVFARLGDEVARALELEADPRFGDLLVRVRRGATGAWEVTARTTPRPLASRAWRRHNVRGALNATIAAAMVRCLPGPTDGPYVNLMCGSGSLLAEYLAAHPGAAAIGVDRDRDMILLARDNAPAATLVEGDARATPLASETVAAISADLPYGQAVGSHGDNAALYAATLADAARLADADARFAVITHDIKRFRSVLAAQSAWVVEREAQVFQKGHNPYIWLLRRGIS